jgi:glycosyltransferase 2 family protein
MSPTATHSQSSIFQTVIRPALFLVGLVFFAILFVSSWHEIKQILQALNWFLFLLSALIALFDNVLFSFLFQNLLTKYGFHIDYPRIGKMYFFGQMAKYIPGRFWSILYHATFLKRQGATSAVLFANLDLTAVVILRNLAVAMALILFYYQAWLAGIMFVLGSFAFWHLGRSCWIANIFRFVTSQFKSFSRNISPCVTCRHTRNILFISTSSWVTYLAANFLVMKAAFNLPTEQAALYIAYFSMAWVIGVISFIVPAGIGIREITFVFLAQYIGQGQAAGVEFLAAIAIVYRFWHIILELSGLCLGFVLGYVE